MNGEVYSPYLSLQGAVMPKHFFWQPGASS